MDTSVLQVEALYSFKGKNNDELCFKKGNIITVTQNDDGTWWEGTMDGKTGWFPANYVKPINDAGSPSSGSSGGGSEQQHYRALVLRNLLDSEREHISHLDTIITACLIPLSDGKISTGDEYSLLLRHMQRVVSVHRELLSRLEGEGAKPSQEQRVGGVFLATAADTLRLPHTDYCSQHPRAVCKIQDHQSEVQRIVENSSLPLDVVPDSPDGSTSTQRRPGLLLLTTGLSRPFRRLQQYPGLLQELHRHLPEAHRDRGDAHRAAKVMADLAASCNEVRRQKELELEVVTGEVRGWERGTLAVLGDLVTMGSVAVLPHLADRYFVLFPQHLVVLAVSPRMSNFIFQSEHLLSEISCTQLEDGDQYKNAIEITGGEMERLVAVCQTKADQQRWVTCLSPSSPARSSSQPPPALPSKLPNNTSLLTTRAISQAGRNSYHSPGSKSSGQSSSRTFTPQPPLPPHMGYQQTPASPKFQPAANKAHHDPATSRQSVASHKTWSLCDLRPSPPLRPNQLKRARNFKKDERWHDEDSVILRVVEAYCASTAQRYTQGSANESSADKSLDKVIPALWDDRSLVSVVHQLRSEVGRLAQEQMVLKRQVTQEKTNNDQLRSVLHQLLPPGTK